MNISFIGFGHLARAIAKGLQSDPTYALKAADPNLVAGKYIEKIACFHDNLDVLPNADAVILAVKPPQMAEVFAQIKYKLPTNCVLISVAAGINLNWFTHEGSGVIPIVRAMPNIAASVGHSATPLIANSYVTSNQAQLAERIFKNIGIVDWVRNEKDLDALTALSGSGPAYVFLFIEAMIDGAMRLGLDEKVARTFALQTFHGAVDLAEHTENSIETLRKSVISPGGTTEKAVDVFIQNNIRDIISKAMQAAYDRALELGS